jgi:hypothetical protein
LDDRESRPLWARLVTVLTVLGALAVVATTGRLAWEREGGLAWDDADYLRRGLQNVGEATGKGVILGAAAVVGRTLRERPKPPLLVAWIEVGRLLLGPGDLRPLILFASVLPFAALCAAAVALARRRDGPAAGLAALVALTASPLCLSFGTKVMVETFMGLWVLLSLASAARLIERPTRGRGVALGTALGLAMMTKLTVALLLTGPLILFLVLYARVHGLNRGAGRVALSVAVPVLLIAGPWYARNTKAAVRFALFSARYNVEAEARPDADPRLTRLPRLAEALAGWPLVGAGLLAGAAAARRPVRNPGTMDHFTLLAAAGAVSGAAGLLVPLYFDPRFLLPIWPALAVCLGGWVAAAGRRDRWLAAPAWCLLGVGLAHSAGALAPDLPRTRTYWAARELIDELVQAHHVGTIANVGNCADWNVCKTGLINELRANPRDCFVLHDLSRSGPEELARRLGRMDAVVVLDERALPPGFLDAAPGLNRAYGAIRPALEGDPRFERVATRVAGVLPPLSVYVRRR